MKQWIRRLGKASSVDASMQKEMVKKKGMGGGEKKYMESRDEATERTHAGKEGASRFFPLT